MASSSSSSSRNWSYDVFPSFSGEDVRKTFLSHLLKELERKSIVVFKDNKIERSQSIAPELLEGIEDSRIAVVVFSKNYASSSWCLNELLEILKCKQAFGQMVIPIFYDLDPSHLRKQSGDFGEAFEKTCLNQREEVKNQWKQALIEAANILGYHSKNCDSEAKMIEEVSSDILSKLNLIPSNDFEEFVGVKDHVSNMISLLDLESEKVRMVGIWGTSGIGKTTIARALFSSLSSLFQCSVFIDRAFVSKSMQGYGRANLNDYNTMLRLRENFMSEILDQKNMKIFAMEERLKHQRVLIVIDDLDDQDVLNALAGQTRWFGSRSRIIAVTTDKRLLRAHGIDSIYKVRLPSEELALKMFCRSAFKQNFPPDGLMEFAFEVVKRAGSLPLGLNILGLSLRGLGKEDCLNMLPRLRRSLDGKIEKTLRVSYDGLDREEDKAIFCHIACLFNDDTYEDIKLLLADSELDVNIGLKNLVDKSLIHVDWVQVKMHRLLQEMGRNIVRTQSIDEPEKREFLVDSKDICDVLRKGNGTQKILGISLNIDEIDGLHVHENAFKGMHNLHFLKIFPRSYTMKYEWFYTWKTKFKLQLAESFDHLPPQLKLLWWDEYPMRCIPSTFRPENLVILKMRNSKLEKLWDGVVSLSCLKEMNLSGSDKLKDIPDLSMATNLEELCLACCMSLVELPSSIQNLHKLIKLDMQDCKKLVTLPTGINLKSLNSLNFDNCSQLRTFPEISTNISFLYMEETCIEEIPSNLRLENLITFYMGNVKDAQLREGTQLCTPFMRMLSPSLTTLKLVNIPSLVELPSSFQNLNKLEELKIKHCINLETLPTGINLESLDYLDLKGCSRLKIFPNISTNISSLCLNETGIEEVPCWIENFSRLEYIYMRSCSNLQYVHLNLFNLINLNLACFSHCGALTRVDLSGYHSREPMEPDDIVTFPRVEFDFSYCFNLDQDVLLQQQSVFENLIMPGEEVPSYFTHRTTGSSSYNLTNIPLFHNSPSQKFFRFRVCVMCLFTPPIFNTHYLARFRVNCRFKGIFGNVFDSFCQSNRFWQTTDSHHLFVWDCCIPLNNANAPVAQLSYDHVDMQLLVSFDAEDDSFTLKGWGIRVLENSSSAESRLGNPNTLPHVCETNEDNMVNIGGHETEQDRGGSDEETEIRSKRKRDQSGGHETEQGEDCGDNCEETEICSKRMRIM